MQRSPRNIFVHFPGGTFCVNKQLTKISKTRLKNLEVEEEPEKVNAYIFPIEAYLSLPPSLRELVYGRFILFFKKDRSSFLEEP